MNKAIPILAHLSRSFQKGSLSFATIEPAIKFTLGELSGIVEQMTALTQLKKDLADGRRLSVAGCYIHLSPEDEKTLTNLTQNYISVLKDNIKNRFAGNMPVLSAFAIFDP